MVTVVMKFRTGESYRLQAATTIRESGMQIAGQKFAPPIEALQRHTIQLPSSSEYGTDSQLAGLLAMAHRLQA
jgi:hypothetical protein